MLAARNLQLKSQVDSLESEVKRFKALIQMIKEQNESSILLNQAPIIASENNFTGEMIGEFNVPVLTQIIDETSQSLQSLVSDSLDGLQGLNHQAPFDQYCQNVRLLTNFDQKVGQDWSGTSLLLDVQLQEDAVTLAQI